MTDMKVSIHTKDGTFIEKIYPDFFIKACFLMKYFKIVCYKSRFGIFFNLARITWPEFLQPRQFSTNVEK